MYFDETIISFNVTFVYSIKTLHFIYSGIYFLISLVHFLINFIDAVYFGIM